jgi:hypothetical protein
LSASIHEAVVVISNARCIEKWFCIRYL